MVGQGVPTRAGVGQDTPDIVNRNGCNIHVRSKRRIQPHHHLTITTLHTRPTHHVAECSHSLYLCVPKQARHAHARPSWCCCRRAVFAMMDLTPLACPRKKGSLAEDAQRHAALQGICTCSSLICVPIREVETLLGAFCLLFFLFQLGSTEERQVQLCCVRC